MTADGKIKASINVTNTGNREGREIVQLYIRDIQGSVARPIKELKHFESVTLAPGETKTIEFTVTPDDLKFYNYDLDFVAEPGEFQIMVGPDSRNLQSLPFTLK